MTTLPYENKSNQIIYTEFDKPTSLFLSVSENMNPQGILLNFTHIPQFDEYGNRILDLYIAEGSFHYINENNIPEIDIINNIDKSYHSISLNQPFNLIDYPRIIIEFLSRNNFQIGMFYGYLDIKNDLNNKLISIFSCITD